MTRLACVGDLQYNIHNVADQLIRRDSSLFPYEYHPILASDQGQRAMMVDVTPMIFDKGMFITRHVPPTHCVSFMRGCGVGINVGILAVS
jgi:hypothetical protein